MDSREYQYTPEMNNRFYLIRTALKKSQKEMGPAMGYSQSTYSKLESKGFTIELKVVLLMCAVYGVSYDYLVYGEGPMFNSENVERHAWVNLYDTLPEPYREMISIMVQGLLDRLHDKDTSDK